MRRRRIESDRGEIRVVAAPMFAGKSTSVITEAKRCERAGWRKLVFKHPLDDRYAGKGFVTNHDGLMVECIAESNLEEIYKKVHEEDAEVVIIDEAQFYTGQDELFIAMVEQFANEGRIVILAGLEFDFRGEVFGPMAKLMAYADKVERLTAICSRCGSFEASRTQRLIDGKPADYNEPIILVGEREAYEARCIHCHEVPGKPTFEQMLVQFLEKES